MKAIFYLVMTLFWIACAVYVPHSLDQSHFWTFIYGMLTAFNLDSFMKEMIK